MSIKIVGRVERIEMGAFRCCWKRFDRCFSRLKVVARLKKRG